MNESARTPVTELDPRYGEPGAPATPWADAEERLGRAEVFWLTTLRADGRPHVTPLLAVLHDGRLHFCTGAGEQKARNLTVHPEVALTTGTDALHDGMDLVVEGRAVRVADDARLHRLAQAWVDKYGEDWRFGVQEGTFVGRHDNLALVYEITAHTAYGFGKSPYSQTRWRF
jgi:nitroimidazol reductase NimA-like FMN-containing flavoprotein (pyridoxamine 5'-phosphate oxidase superfamily)